MPYGISHYVPSSKATTCWNWTRWYYRARCYSHINYIKINSMERKPMNSKVIVLKNGKVVDSESMRVVIADVVISAGVIT